MPIHRSPSRAARAAAARWLARLNGDQPAPGDAAAFHAWLEIAPDNRAAFAAAARTWDLLGGLGKQLLPRRPR